MRQVRVRRRSSAARVEDQPGTAALAKVRSRNDALDRLLAVLDELLD